MIRISITTMCELLNATETRQLTNCSWSIRIWKTMRQQRVRLELHQVLSKKELSAQMSALSTTKSAIGSAVVSEVETAGSRLRSRVMLSLTRLKDVSMPACGPRYPKMKKKNGVTRKLLTKSGTFKNARCSQRGLARRSGAWEEGLADVQRRSWRRTCFLSRKWGQGCWGSAQICRLLKSWELLAVSGVRWQT